MNANRYREMTWRLFLLFLQHSSLFFLFINLTWQLTSGARWKWAEGNTQGLGQKLLGDICPCIGLLLMKTFSPTTSLCYCFHWEMWGTQHPWVVDHFYTYAEIQISECCLKHSALWIFASTLVILKTNKVKTLSVFHSIFLILRYHGNEL